MNGRMRMTKIGQIILFAFVTAASASDEAIFHDQSSPTTNDVIIIHHQKQSIYVT